MQGGAVSLALAEQIRLPKSTSTPGTVSFKADGCISAVGAGIKSR